MILHPLTDTDNVFSGDYLLSEGLKLELDKVVIKKDLVCQEKASASGFIHTSTPEALRSTKILKADGTVCDIPGSLFEVLNNSDLHPISYIGKNYNQSGAAHEVENTCGSLILGNSNTVSDGISIVVGGADNIIDSELFSVISGDGNTTLENTSCIIGGYNNAILQGSDNIVSGSGNESTSDKYSIISGFKNSSTSGFDNIISGKENTIIGTSHSVIEGLNNNVTSGDSMIVIGHNNTASGNRNIICGSSSLSSGNNCLIMGANQISVGHNNLLLGQKHKISGSGNNVFGISNTINNNATSSFISGLYNLTNKSYNLIFGRSNTVYGELNISMGTSGQIRGDKNFSLRIPEYGSTPTVHAGEIKNPVIDLIQLTLTFTEDLGREEMLIYSVYYNTTKSLDFSKYIIIDECTYNGSTVILKVNSLYKHILEEASNFHFFYLPSINGNYNIELGLATVSGNNTINIGHDVITTNDFEIALGSFNKSEKGKTILSIGYGNNGSRKNCFEIKKEDGVIKGYINGKRILTEDDLEDINARLRSLGV